jgi:hypothetical protein
MKERTSSARKRAAEKEGAVQDGVQDEVSKKRASVDKSNKCNGRRASPRSAAKDAGKLDHANGSQR